MRERERERVIGSVAVARPGREFRWLAGREGAGPRRVVMWCGVVHYGAMVVEWCGIVWCIIHVCIGNSSRHYKYIFESGV